MVREGYTILSVHIAASVLPGEQKQKSKARRLIYSMTAREYLSTIRTLDIKINQKVSELDELHNIATTIGSFDYSKEKVQVSPEGEARFTKTAELAAELDKEIHELETQKQSIIESIRALNDPRYVSILYKRYVEYKSFEEIRKETGYVLTYTWQLHTEALAAIERRMLYE